MGMATGRHFTTEEARKGGWARARYWALWRRDNPSPAEKTARDLLTALGVAFEAEHEITHAGGRPQWFDLYIPSRKIAIEIDGSHGWHSWNAEGSKMALLDEIKARWCEAHGVTLYRLAVKDLTIFRFTQILDGKQ